MDQIIDVDTMFGPLPAGAADLSVDELAEMMRRHGVQACCTLSTVGMLLDHNAGNGATRAACSEQSGLLPVATWNPQVSFAGEGPFSRFKSDGFKMVRFFPAEQGWDPAYAPMRQLAKALQADSLPLMIDVEKSGAATRVAESLAGNPAPVILTGVDETTIAEAVALMRDNDRLYLSTANLVAVGLVRQVVDSVGAERLLYGSGAPSRPMASALGVLRFAGLAGEQQAAILGGNARRLFGV
jgi:predicted TIM-barrel fold metal-dependent hydrolase